jgi:2C-methyl-D-erythritol 2,4-cyclodiphosphate synthase
LHSVANKIKSFGEGIAKEILILKASIAAKPKLALEIVTIQEDIDKLLHIHEESVKMKLDEVSKMASVSLCS